MTPVHTIAAGAGFAGDRVDPAVALARSGEAQAVILECLAERTIVPGLRARRSNPEGGADPRLRRRLSPLLPAARASGCRIISSLGPANPPSAARQIVRLASEQGWKDIRVAAVVGDDVLPFRDSVKWDTPFDGDLIGAHAYLGADAFVGAVRDSADVVVTGRVADSALFAAELIPHLAPGDDSLAGALVIGHLLECTGHITGGNFGGRGYGALTAEDYADLGYPVARVAADGSAIITLLPGARGRIDRLTCTLQLFYEVHDPAVYITPDAIIDLTGVRFEEVGPNSVRVSGARVAGRPTHLKVSGFVEGKGAIADVEIGYSGGDALSRAQTAAEVLRMRFADVPADCIRIDIVGVNSILGGSSNQRNAEPSEARVHISVLSKDADFTQVVEDEVYSLSISGPAGGGSMRSERRPQLQVIDGLIPRELVKTDIVWSGGHEGR